MAKKRIVWSKEARADFKATLEFYNERNGSSTYSRKLANQVFKATENLQTNNHLGISTSDPDVRVLIKDTFSIFYELKGEIILVLIIWDSRRNPDELKKYLP
ncbi:type II toxin-antitoxin system RelE/ParE family toxin [Pontibacter diazotrophicus]|uniref:Type II toxin-antitoxin system RelE/ParE family toxin n=1 Tax=Pontibacter diazotrophicus TaxID=1400979 RepID=A0A3D8LB38_9BACT|nr:type II toxin-antitoxin system RelE/ParE family toxin [Pontibacter diazotrophicus]RDV14610.1 type II toxin-antitoxin system RelE/ParE family toxin [Pontibacter diazotrophicus]